MARMTDIDRLRGTMTFHMQIILSSSGEARMTRSPGRLTRDERAIAVKIKVPTAIFSAPTLRATIEIPAVNQAAEIDIEAAQDALRKALGLDFDIAVHHPEGD